MSPLPNPFLLDSTLALTGVEPVAAPDLTDPPDAATGRFELDVDAFLSDIEPLPAFLGAPRAVYLDAVALRPIVEILAGHM